VNRLFTPLALGFRVGVAFRRTAYRRGWFKTHRLNRPVVSVGNLTAGGAGKTPLVMYIAERLLNRGWNPVILTRGYGRRRGADIISLAPGSGRRVDAREVGDEPALLARALPRVPIVVCADRHRAGQVAEESFPVDVHLLDDGFQHWRLARDVDVVALDVTQEFSDWALLPAGRLREPCAAVARAHLVVLTRTELCDPLTLHDRVHRLNPQARIFLSSTSLRNFVDVQSGGPFAVQELRGQPLCAFCGIGNPSAFFADVRRWGFSVVAEVTFPDHHVYSAEDLRRLAQRARRAGAAALLTTEKDALNLPPAWDSEIPVTACVIQTELREAEAFEAALLARLETVRVGK
jgi:tetraacyldisaccharide 4'-kinase